MRAEYRKHNLQIQQLAKNNLGGFWRFINNKRNDNKFPTVMNLDEFSASDGIGITNLVSKHFQSVLKPSTSSYNYNYSIQGDQSSGTDHCNLDPDISSDITIDELIRALSNLKSSYYCSPDGVPAVFIKKSGHLILYPLWILFNKLLKDGICPINENVFMLILRPPQFLL